MCAVKIDLEGLLGEEMDFLFGGSRLACRSFGFCEGLNGGGRSRGNRPREENLRRSGRCFCNMDSIQWT